MARRVSLACVRVVDVERSLRQRVHRLADEPRRRVPVAALEVGIEGGARDAADRRARRDGKHGAGRLDELARAVAAAAWDAVDDARRAVDPSTRRRRQNVHDGGALHHQRMPTRGRRIAEQHCAASQREPAPHTDIGGTALSWQKVIRRCEGAGHAALDARINQCRRSATCQRKRAATY